MQGILGIAAIMGLGEGFGSNAAGIECRLHATELAAAASTFEIPANNIHNISSVQVR